jgi:hypothetical protein
LNGHARRRDQKAGDLKEGAMADRRSLGILGFLFAGITVAVVLTAAIVVKQNIDALALQSAPQAMVASAERVVAR